jgi:YggT family protein
MVRAMNEPLMRPLRRFIPPIGGVDLSPLVAFLILRISVFLADNLIYSL